ncbi:UNVERIFIED_CONTAM: G-patch domain-containing protein [Hammondia hammondi]|eukprot:XP_008887075.1 G-patch domain-containing protein [Hammondia hammondi]
MSKKFYDRLLKGSGVQSRPFHSSFGASILKKFGWEEGQGLGRENTGRTDCLQIRRREENVGLGHSDASETKGEDQWKNWWDVMYNSMAAKLKDSKGALRAATESESDSDSSAEEDGATDRFRRRSLVRVSQKLSRQKGPAETGGGSVCSDGRAEESEGSEEESTSAETPSSLSETSPVAFTAMKRTEAASLSAKKVQPEGEAESPPAPRKKEKKKAKTPASDAIAEAARGSEASAVAEEGDKNASEKKKRKKSRDMQGESEGYDAELVSVEKKKRRKEKKQREQTGDGEEEVGRDDEGQNERREKEKKKKKKHKDSR